MHKIQFGNPLLSILFPTPKKHNSLLNSSQSLIIYHLVSDSSR